MRKNDKVTRIKQSYQIFTLKKYKQFAYHYIIRKNIVHKNALSYSLTRKKQQAKELLV